jgi:predicted transcriptional regulator
VLGALETEVMEELWSHGRGTVREVLEAVNARHPTPRAYTTVLTVMQRLHAKGLLRRERHGRRDVYVPALSREGYAEARAQALVEEYGDIALAHFARRISGLDEERRRQVRRLAEDG